MAGYSRYVAIGDSQTEGLWDGDDTVGLRGFGDRLAQIVDTQYPGLTYANLAVRGRRIRDLLDDQLPQALAMDPDLVSVCIGMNDVTRPGPGLLTWSPCLVSNCVFRSADFPVCRLCGYHWDVQ